MISNDNAMSSLSVHTVVPPIQIVTDGDADGDGNANANANGDADAAAGDVNAIGNPNDNCNARDQIFLSSLNLIIKDELHEIDETEPIEAYTVYKGAFNQVRTYV